MLDDTMPRTREKRMSTFRNHASKIFESLKGNQHANNIESQVNHHADFLYGVAQNGLLMAACHQLCGNLLLATRTSGASQFLFTGVHGGEAEYSTLIGLALSIRQATSSSVLVVDANLREPGLNTLLGLPEGPGLVDLLNGKVAATTITHQLQPHFGVITSGTPVPGVESLLVSPGVEDYVAELAKNYRYVLFATSPSLRYSDSTLLATVITNVVLFVTLGSDTEQDIRRCQARLANNGAKILGLATLVKL